MERTRPQRAGSRRVPGPDPVVRYARSRTASDRTVRTPWLPQPATWAQLSVGAQAEDHTSMLLLYRNALALRRFIAGEESLTWIDGLGPEVLAFRRGDGFICVVNFSDGPAEVPEGSEVLLASDPSYVAGAALAPDTAAWLRG